MRFSKIFLPTLAVILFSAVDSSAAPISTVGTVVGGFGSNTSVASLGTGDYLEMFIPISQPASGTLGINGVGVTADQGSGGGSVDIYFNFGIIADALTDVKLVFDFIDFDLQGANDLSEDKPNTFGETVYFFSPNGNVTNTIDGTDDDVAGYFDVFGDYTNQQIVFSDISPFFTPSSTDPFILGLHFTSLFVPEIFGVNTAEYVRATLSANAVPEPATLLLVGAGGMAIAWRRRRTA